MIETLKLWQMIHFLFFPSREKKIETYLKEQHELVFLNHPIRPLIELYTWYVLIFLAQFIIIINSV